MGWIPRGLLSGESGWYIWLSTVLGRIPGFSRWAWKNGPIYGLVSRLDMGPFWVRPAHNWLLGGVWEASRWLSSLPSPIEIFFLRVGPRWRTLLPLMASARRAWVGPTDPCAHNGPDFPLAFPKWAWRIPHWRLLLTKKTPAPLNYGSWGEGAGATWPTTFPMQR